MGHKKWIASAALALGVAAAGMSPSAVAQPEGASAGSAASATTATATLAGALETTGSARGEGRSGRSGRGSWSGGLFKSALEVSGLTDEQKTKLQALEKEHQAKLEALRAKQTPAPAGESRRGSWGSPELRQEMQDARKKIEEVLNEEQKKEFATKTDFRRGRGGDRGTTRTRSN